MEDTQESNQQIQREIEWEGAMIQRGIDRYRKAQEQAKKMGEEDRLKAHQRLLVSSIDPLARKLESIFKEIKDGKAGRKSSHLSYILEMNPEVIALLTTKIVLGSLSKKRGFQSVARQLGNTIEDQLVYDAFKKIDKDYFKWVKEENKKATSSRHTRFSLLGHAKNAGVSSMGIPADTKVTLGYFLIKLFAWETSVIEILQPNKKAEQIIQISPKAQQYLHRMNYVFQDAFPVYMPMLIPPTDWSSMNDGGYLTRKLTLVKSNLEGVVSDPEHLPGPAVLSAINTLQKTPWRINQPVLAVMQELWESESEIGNLPPRENYCLPDLPEGLHSDEEEAVEAYKQANPDAWKAWKSQRKTVYSENRRLMSKRMIVGDVLGLAQQLSRQDRFYYVYQADWRGRLYPVSGSALHPQGSDFAKSLLEFAEGKRLGKEGVKWLKRHVANCFGVDKVSWEEREKWVDEHAHALSLCAIDPLTFKFWLEGDGGQKPWQALAACFAWDEYMKHGEDAIIHISINLDGSCNGLQHLSGLLLDSFGADATNLQHHDKPADIYSLVAKRVAAQVEEDARIGNKFALAWEGKINRKLVKRNVMTVSYGATRFGMLEQIREDLNKELDGKTRDYLGIPEDEKMFPYFSYVSGLVQKYINEVVVAAPTVMDWLQECANVLAETNLPIKWVTPSGFPVLQSYLKTEVRRINTIVGDVRVQVKTYSPTKEINRARSVLGVSPNAIHSMDACHMQETINACVEEGIEDFCMIHDSYGTHAADVEKLARILREQFVKLYSQNILENLYQQFLEQVPDELKEKLPKPPKRGDFNIELVKSSGYFFA